MTATLTLESPIDLGNEGSRMEHLLSGACSQKEGVDVDSSESKGVTNGGNGHKSHSPPAEKRIAEESTVRYL